MTTQKILIALAVSLLGSPALAGRCQAATVLFVQNPDFSGNAWASQNDPTPSGLGNFATSFDDFTLATTSTISEVKWVGEYFNPVAQGTITSWNLSFYADNLGLPGTLIDSVNVGGNGNETLLGAAVNGIPAYFYDVTLPQALSVQGGTQYWMSLVPTVAFPPQWGWATSTQGDGTLAQDSGSGASLISGDLAFALLGSPQAASVPEPASMALFGVGAACMFFFRRRLGHVCPAAR